MKSALRHALLLCCLVLPTLPAHAVITCTRQDLAARPAVSPRTPDEAMRIARALAGVAPPAETASPAYRELVTAAEEGWQAYVETYARPLTAWAARELPNQAGKTAFYPFSGPDLPSVLAVFPAAPRIVMVSDQYANRHYDPEGLKESEQARLAHELAEAWLRFGRLGFFLTTELNRTGAQKNPVGPTMILMAFAVRLGYDIRNVTPVCLDAADLSLRPIEAQGGRWGSVRLELHKDGRDLVIDYLQQDLSNRGLHRHPEARALIESLARGPVLLKAASHLPQMANFSLIRDAILANSPLLVQDETGLEYADMAQSFRVKLYGEYVAPHRLFKEATNASLVRAYKDWTKVIHPLDFRLGYEKEAGSAIQVGTRK